MKMNNEYKLINLKEKEHDDKAVECFQTIEQANYKLYQFIMDNLNRDSAIGIRDDVLAYVSANATKFGDNQTYLFNIANFLNNLKVSAEHLAWVNDFYSDNENHHMAIDDFGIVFIEAVERDIPLAKIKELFSTDDEMVIYEKVISYNPDNEEKGPAEENESISTYSNSEPTKKIIIEQKQPEEPGIADVFDSLVTALSAKSEDTDDIHSASENFNKIAAKFQLATSEFAVYSAEIVHSMETDKKEIEKLKALLTLQQKLMNSQQNKINDLRNEIMKLNYKIQNAEKTEMRREAINQKISELQNLTLNTSLDTVNEYYLNE